MPYKFLIRIGLPCVLLLAGCSHSGPRPLDVTRESIAAIYRDPMAETRSVEVFYATNREMGAGGPPCGEGAYSSKISGSPHFGMCAINAPSRRPVGATPVNSDPRSDSHAWFKPLNENVLSPDAFKDALLRNKDEGVLIFVHGFNVPFEEAVVRAAQISFDLKFQGPTVLVSWPAGAEDGFLSGARLNRIYENNRRNAVDSIAFMTAVLKTVAEAADQGVPVTMLVHSMGHQVVLPAVVAVSKERGAPFLRELVLNAPDFAIDDFQSIAGDLGHAASRITLYCSYKDTAIAASERYNNNRRMGACARAPGVDVINVGEVDPSGVTGLGHGYYASRPILTDLFQLIMGMKAESRMFIRKADPNTPEDFFLRQ